MVEVILIWSETETKEEMDDADFEPLDIVDFLSRVEELPLPGCD